MKKGFNFITIFGLMMMLSANVFAQIAAWDFTSATTSATTVGAGISASSVTVVPATAISYQASPGDIYCGTWSTSATFSTAGKYWEFSITPNFGMQITISSVTFKAGRTATGPAKMQVQYSLDGFATSGVTALGETNNSNTSSLDQFSLTALPPSTTNAITFRIWGYGASSTGNFRLNNIVINGSVVSTLDPGSGIGAASVLPYMWKYSTPTPLQFVVKPASDTVHAIRIIKPSVLNWNSGAITVTPDSLALTFLGDTVQITNLELRGQDSVVVTVPNVTATDTTNIFSIMVQTHKWDSPFGQIALLPKVFVYGSPRPIAQVKKKEANGTYSLLGKWAVIKGVVTVANEFAGGTAPGGPAYIQDATAGATLYDTAIVNHVQRGDEIVVLGQVAPFNELFELAPCSLLEILSAGNSFDTTVVTIAQLNAQPQSGVETYEGRLVRINNITSVTNTSGGTATSWAVSGSGTNYNITDATATMQVRISPRVNLANLPTPVGNFDLVCVVGQFNTSYQVLPRSVDDVIPEGDGPRFSSVPKLTSITPTSLSFSWTTDVPGSSIVKYGLTTAYGTTYTDTNKVTNHSVTLSNLSPATIYQIQFGSENSGGTTLTQNGIYSTSSLSSTQVMNVYFNKSVDTSLARGEKAQSLGNGIVNKLLARINAATYSIDAALYSLSGTVGANVASALVAAKGRGVKVRVIGENDNSGTAPWTTLSNNSIPLIFDNYDATNAGVGYMHNKFIIIDNRNSSLSDTNDWVWTGSWNATDPGNNNDAQNAIEIQDRALANAYTREFEEMWGSSTETPSSSASRFGARKLDNTPHQFIINGTPVELYFSPSDHTTNQIIRTVNNSAYSIDIEMYSFTRNDIANAVIAKKKAGLKVHAIADGHNDSWSVFDSLAANGVDVRVKGSDVTGFLHHKYAIFDAESNLPNQYVITGSHNWSSNAENSNNENTLIINSPRIANLYLQEFGARYKNAGGTDQLLLVEKHNDVAPRVYSLQQNYPNPFNPTTTIQFNLAERSLARLTIYDVLGREITTLVNEQLTPGTYSVQWNASSYASGVYFYRLESGSFVQTKKLILQK